MTNWSREQIAELAAAIADPSLTLAEVPHWPDWFRQLSESDQDSIMRALMDERQPLLEAQLWRLFNDDGTEPGDTP